MPRWVRLLGHFFWAIAGGRGGQKSRHQGRSAALVPTPRPLAFHVTFDAAVWADASQCRQDIEMCFKDDFNDAFWRSPTQFRGDPIALIYCWISIWKVRGVGKSLTFLTFKEKGAKMYNNQWFIGKWVRLTCSYILECIFLCHWKYENKFSQNVSSAVSYMVRQK